MLRTDPPIRTRVRRSDRLPFVKDRRGAVKQRSIHDVAVADGPADVGRGPEYFSGADAEDVTHAPRERYGMATVVAHDPFRDAGGSRRVVNVERIGGFDG